MQNGTQMQKETGNFKPAGRGCSLKLVDGKLWCCICKAFHKVSTRCPGEEGGHELIRLPILHTVYKPFYCETCNDGKILVNEED